MTLTPSSSLEETLNAYIADEYFASLQYRMAKVVAKGKALEYSNNIFGDNGDEEDEHFDEIVEYAQSLNIPVKVNPSEMEVNCTTPFVEIHDGDTTAQLVSILIAAEKKAIEGYEIGLRNDAIIEEHPELVQFLGEKLNDERGHLKELEDLESNISADGKTVPQSDDGDEEDEEETTDAEDDVTDGGDDGEAEDEGEGEEDEEKDSTNESMEEDDNGCSNELLRFIALNEPKVREVLEKLIRFLPEERLSDFADMNDYFNSELARNTSQYDKDQCKEKFLEMIADGMLDPTKVVTELVEFVGDDEISEFSNVFNYGKSENGEGPIVDSVVRGPSLSFSRLFKNSVVR